MSDETRTLRLVPTVEERTVRPTVRVGLALVGLLVLVGLATVLPGLDRLLSGMDTSLTALLLAVATTLVVAALLRVAPDVERATEQALDGPDAVVGHAAASAKLLVGFLSTVVAYHGFAPAVQPLFAAFDIGGLYHLGFLIVAVSILAALGRRLYSSYDPATDLFTRHVVEATGRDADHISTEP